MKGNFQGRSGNKKKVANSVSIKFKEDSLVTRHLLVLPYILIAGAAILRLGFVGPYNVVPVFTCLLFFGACRPVREYAMPFLALVCVDIFLTTHQYGFVLTSGHAVTWAWYMGAMVLGAATLSDSISTPRVLGSSLLASVSFFVASNFTVWAEWGIYPKTLSGLGSCYIAALPFFRNSIISETAFSVLVFTFASCSQMFLPARYTRRSCS